MKKSISFILAIIMIFSVVSVTAFAVGVPTPQATASNDVGGIKVYWNTVDGAVKYNVYRRIGGSSSWVLAGTTTGTKIVDKNVKNGNYYVYSIRAYDENNNYSDYNSALTYTVKCVSTPKLTSLVNDTNGLKLTWSAVSGATYRVYRRGAGSSSWLYLGTTSSTTYTDSKATSGAYWRYTVRAVSSGYYSGFDTNGLYTMRLANPYSIKTDNYYDGVKVSWAKINGATGYRVYRRSAGQTSWSYLGATTGNSFEDSKVSYGQYYRYTVRATRGSIYSGFYSDGSVIKFSRDVVLSSEICKINGKLYASYPVGHVKDSAGRYTKISSNPKIPRIPVRKGEDIGEICYYKGYVYYTATPDVFSGDYNIYRCKADFTGEMAIGYTGSKQIEIVNNKLHYYGGDIDLSTFSYDSRTTPEVDELYNMGEDYNIVCASNDEAIISKPDLHENINHIYYYNGNNLKKCLSLDATFSAVYSYVDGYIYYSTYSYNNPNDSEY